MLCVGKWGPVSGWRGPCACGVRPAGFVPAACREPWVHAPARTTRHAPRPCRHWSLPLLTCAAVMPHPSAPAHDTQDAHASMPRTHVCDGACADTTRMRCRHARCATAERCMCVYVYLRCCHTHRMTQGPAEADQRRREVGGALQHCLLPVHAGGREGRPRRAVRCSLLPPPPASHPSRPSLGGVTYAAQPIWPWGLSVRGVNWRALRAWWCVTVGLHVPASADPCIVALSLEAALLSLPPPSRQAALSVGAMHHAQYISMTALAPLPPPLARPPRVRLPGAWVLGLQPASGRPRPG